MDYHSMKRKELQALCKEHNIPANLANSVLADKLSALLNGKPKLKTRQRTCMKSPVESTDEGEPAEQRQAKKVRFSPNNDLLEYQSRSGEKQKDMVTQTKTRRKSVAIISEQVPVKVTRSRVQSSVKEVVSTNNEKKKGRRGAKDVEKETVGDKETEVNVGKVTRSKAKGGGVQLEENKQSKSVVKEETVVVRARATRSKAQTLTADGTVSEANLKKKSGKEVKTEEQNVEPSNVPVRATRSRRQTTKEDIENTVTNNTQTDKKRTRREMKATDSSHVDPVDKQELPKRKSSRTRGAETVVEDESDKKEVVKKSRVTRSKAPMAKETSGRNKNKASKVESQQPVEPLKHEGKKNVNRRKSVVQTEEIEEPVNHPARKNTRRKSVVQKATKTAESPTVGTSKSPKRRGIPIKEAKSIESPKGSSRSVRSEGKSVAGTPSSRKRRGTPVIEVPIIEKSTKSSMRSAGKSEGKAAVKKQVESSVKKPMSKGKSSVIRSGAMISDGGSRKRAKLSEAKQTDSEDHAVNFTKEWTPVAKMKNLKLDEVSEPVVTPAVVKSGRRFTRSTVKEQPDAEAQLLSPKVAKFKHDPAVNTAPGRITRRGVKHDGNAAGSFSEKVGNKKQTRQSVHKKPLDNAEVASPEATEAGPTTDTGNKEVQSEVKQLDAQVQMSSLEVAEVGPASDVGTIGDESEVKQPLDEVQMSAPEVAEIRPTADDVIIRDESEVKQPFNEVQMSAPEVAEVGPTSDVGTIGDESEVKQPLDEVQMSAPEVAEVGPTSDVGTIGDESEVKKPLDVVSEVGPALDVGIIGDQPEVKQPLDEVQKSAPEVSEAGVNPDVDTVGVQSEIEQSYDNVQTSSPKVADVQPNSDGDTTEAEYETSGQTLGDLSASEFSRLPTTVVEENASVEIVEDAGACNEEPVTENLFSEKQQSPLESESLDAGTTGTPLEENLSHNLMMPVPMTDAADTVPVQNQNEEVSVPTIVVEENIVSVEENIVSVETMEDSGAFNEKSVSENLFSEKQQSPLESESVDAETTVTPSGENLSHTEMPPVPIADAAETVPVQNQNTEGYVEPGLVTEAVNLVIAALKSGGHDVTEKEMESTESGSTKGMQTDVMIEEPLVSVSQTVVVDKNDDADGGQQYDEDESASAQKPLIPEPDSEDRVDVQEHPFSGNDVYVECDNAASDRVSPLDMSGTPMLGKGNVQDADINVSKELEAGSEPPNANINVDNIERAIDDNSDVHDEEFEHDQSVNNDSFAIDVNVGGDNSEPAQNENVAMADEVLVASCNKEAEQSLNVVVEDAPEGDTFVRVDAMGDTCDLDEDDDGNEENLSEFDEGFQPNEIGSISSDTRFEQTEEEAEPGRRNDLTIDQTREEASPISYTKGESTIDNVNSSQLVGDIGARESLITQESSPITYKEESLVDDTESEIPTFKEDDGNTQDKTQNAGTSIDWGDFDYEMDAFEKPVSANESADVEGEGKTDFQASVTSSAYLTNSVRKLEKDSKIADDGNPNREADITEVFDWPDSSLKSLLKTPGPSKTGPSKTVNFAFSDSRGNEDIGSSRAASRLFNLQWDNSETQDNAARDPENVIQGVPSFEDYSNLFGDEVGGSTDRLESNTQFESEQFKSSNEAAETSHHDHPSGFKDDSTWKFEKEVTPMKVPKADDDLTFDTGHA